MDFINKIIVGNNIEILKKIPEKSINMCVTSPPYWGLRDYGVEGQIGLEKTPQEYVLKLVEVFREVKRVLRDDGTVWLNLGDTYFPHGGSRGNKKPAGDTLRGRNNDYQPAPKFDNNCGLKQKDLVGVPWRVAFALQDDGWYLRSDIIWSKPNPMPQSVKDRPTTSHEYIFLLSKKPRYYYDMESIREPLSDSRQKQAGTKVDPGNDADKRKKQIEHDVNRGSGGHFDGHKWFMNPNGKNKRTVWSVNTKPFKGAHFAVFPPELIKPCILAGCPEKGIVLDPFFGSGTTGIVAKENNRNFVGIELSADYAELANKRIN